MYDWAESIVRVNNRFLVQEKGQLQQDVFSFTGQSWDFPDATRKVATATTGKTACELLHNKFNRDFIISKLPPHQDTLRKC